MSQPCPNEDTAHTLKPDTSSTLVLGVDANLNPSNLTINNKNRSYINSSTKNYPKTTRFTRHVPPKRPSSKLSLRLPPRSYFWSYFDLSPHSPALSQHGSRSHRLLQRLRKHSQFHTRISIIVIITLLVILFFFINFVSNVSFLHKNKYLSSLPTIPSNITTPQSIFPSSAFLSSINATLNSQYVIKPIKLSNTINAAGIALAHVLSPKATTKPGLLHHIRNAEAHDVLTGGSNPYALGGIELPGLSVPDLDSDLHPMNGDYPNLRVSANTGRLPLSSVRNTYRRLARTYLSSFRKRGIPRSAYYDILRRRTSLLTPLGAKPGMQSMLIQIVNGRVYLTDPYKVTRNSSKPFYRTRANEVTWLLSKLAQERRIKDTEFILSVHDCIQTASARHEYNGPEFLEQNPIFTVIGCNFSSNIPFPVWEGPRPFRDGGFESWDGRMRQYAKESATSRPWKDKIPQAIFRGSFRTSLFFRNESHAHDNCDKIGRIRLKHVAERAQYELNKTMDRNNQKMTLMQRLNPLNVSVGGTCGRMRMNLERMTEKDHHTFKYIIYAEGICMWSDRIRHQLFGASMVIKQETACGQFFEPLLRPFVHYVPTDFFFSDVIDRVKWARAHDRNVENIVKNANEFASNFLSLAAIKAYAEVLLNEYTALLHEKKINLEYGAIDVTNKTLCSTGICAQEIRKK